MSENFLKFKRKYNGQRILRVLLGALGGGLFFGGLAILLIKLTLLPLDLFYAIPIAAVVFLAVGVILFVLLKRSDEYLAKRLDREFDLKERTETMLAYSQDEGAMLELQRQDAESALAKIKVRDFKLPWTWAYLVVALVGVIMLTCSFIVPDMREYEPPEKIVPFELTEMHIAGMNELIRQVDESEMDEEYKTQIVNELNLLLDDLKDIKTMPEMQLRLAKTMALVLDVTSRSSDSAEILNALWDSGDVYIRYLAVALDTSFWSQISWSDYAEALDEYLDTVLYGDPKDEPLSDEENKSRLLGMLDGCGRKIRIALDGSGVDKSNSLVSLLLLLAECDGESEYGELRGFSAISKMTNLSYPEICEKISQAIDLLAEPIFAAISHMRTNALVGEHTMTRLSNLFLVPLPEFERPDFVKYGYTVDPGGAGDGEEEEEGDGSSDGGVGEGATFGSKDLVLDPMTGNYVEYGVLIDKYYALVFEKLDSGIYTAEEQEMIKKYFDLLYSGMEKEEGK